MEDQIRKYALQNAIKFDGKANPGAIIGKLMQENPEIKSKLKNPVVFDGRNIYDAEELRAFGFSYYGIGVN